MRLLFLYGVNETKEIWEHLLPYFKNYEVDCESYSKEETLKVRNPNELAKIVYEKYKNITYDAIIGHSLGGIIGLFLMGEYHLNSKKLICLDTNFKPAKEFYRNLMTQVNMLIYGNKIFEMFKNEHSKYLPEMFDSLQNDFDYTNEILTLNKDIYVLYGDRGIKDYSNKFSDLNLSQNVLDKLKIQFIKNSCHMLMIENPQDTALAILKIVEDKNDD